MQPFGGLVRVALHEEGEPGATGRVAHAGQLLLARIRIVRVGQPRLTVAVTRDLALGVLAPLSHPVEDNLPSCPSP